MVRNSVRASHWPEKGADYIRGNRLNQPSHWKGVIADGSNIPSNRECQKPAGLTGVGKMRGGRDSTTKIKNAFSLWIKMVAGSMDQRKGGGAKEARPASLSYVDWPWASCQWRGRGEGRGPSPSQACPVQPVCCQTFRPHHGAALCGSRLLPGKYWG